MGHEVFVRQVEDSGLSVVHIVPRKAPGRVRAISCQGGKARLPSHIHSTDNSTAAITDGSKSWSSECLEEKENIARDRSHETVPGGARPGVGSGGDSRFGQLQHQSQC